MPTKKVAVRGGLVAVAVGVTIAGTTTTASANVNAPWIGYGYSTNTHAVWCVQHDINYFSTHNAGSSAIPVISEDGIWGPQTYNAVRWYQNERFGPSTVDGIVGPLTGGDLLVEGDPYYNGAWPANGYCSTYLPTYS